MKDPCTQLYSKTQKIFWEQEEKRSGEIEEGNQNNRSWLYGKSAREDKWD